MFRLSLPFSAVIASLLLILFVPACGESSGPSTDSETHWMQTCQTDADCQGASSCLCNFCTTECGECGDVDADAVCLPAPSACELGSAPICVDECTDGADCGDGFSCREGACIPEQLATYDGPYCGDSAWHCSELDEGPLLSTDRRNFEVAVLDDRRVLIIGGTTTDDDDASFEDAGVASAEIFDPITNMVRPAGELSTRRDGSLIQAGDGSVLFFGGRDFDDDQQPLLTSVEHFDPDTESWTLLDTPLSAHSMTAVKSTDGHILFAGGRVDEENVSFVDFYDANDKTLTAVAPTERAYRSVELTALADGRILLLATDNDTVEPDENDHTEVGRIDGELYDPTSDTWTTIDPLQLNTWVGQTVAEPLASGAILVLFSHRELGDEITTPINATSWAWLNQITAVTYDPVTDEWTELHTFETSGGGLQPDITALSGAGSYLVSLYGDVHDSTFGYLFDADEQQFDHLFDRRPVPGHVREVLPDGRILFGSPAPRFDWLAPAQHPQIYDIETDQWSDLAAVPLGLDYRGVTLLSDCRLLLADPFVRSGVLTDESAPTVAYCTPE